MTRPERDAIAETPLVDPAEQAFAKAGKAMQPAIAEFQRLQAMDLDPQGRSKLLGAIASCLRQLDMLQMSTMP